MLDDIKNTLWATADKLRASMDAAEYRRLVLGLIFVKYISDTFSAKLAELTRRFADPADDYFLYDSTPARLQRELEDRDYYCEVNTFWVPEAARWEALRAAAKQPDIGKRVDEALSLIEAENPKLKGMLDKRFARAARFEHVDIARKGTDAECFVLAGVQMARAGGCVGLVGAGDIHGGQVASGHARRRRHDQRRVEAVSRSQVNHCWCLRYAAC